MTESINEDADAGASVSDAGPTACILDVRTTPQRRLIVTTPMEANPS
jgi:hypothetical protein